MLSYRRKLNNIKKINLWGNTNGNSRNFDKNRGVWQTNLLV